MSTEREMNSALIGSDRVEGTSVFGAQREKIGSIERLMIEKESGKVAYAVLSFGGILGIGDDHYPLPWSTLKFDRELGGYLTSLSEAQIKNAPKYGRTNEWDWEDDARSQAVHEYYGVPLTGF